MEAELKPRHRVGLVAIALTLGAPAMMMWLGRFKLAMVYTVVIALVIFAVLFDANGAGTLVRIAPWISLESFLNLILVGVSLAALVHAFVLNKKLPTRPWYSRWFVALPAHALGFAAIALITRSFFYQPFDIPSTSSVPSLLVGDVILVSKQAYRNADPQRGDIAVFKLPTDPNTDYVKRIIGIPGDKIQLVDSVVHLNGMPLKKEPTTLPAEFATEPAMKFYRETLPNGRSYVIADTFTSSADDTVEYLVPEGHYFTLGDNRDNSMDSRFLDAVGYIPRGNFIGPFATRLWNAQGFSMSGRPEEIPAQN